MRMLLVAAILAGGCSEEVNVSVNCITTAAPAVECDVEQTKGKTEVEACWDFEIKCGNGAVVKAPHACQKVGGGAKVKHVTPADKLAGLDKCGGEKPVATMSNMTINGKASQ